MTEFERQTSGIGSYNHCPQYLFFCIHLYHILQISLHQEC